MKITPWIKTFCIAWAAVLLPWGQDVWALSRWWWRDDLESRFLKGCLDRYICKADPSQPWHHSLKTLPMWPLFTQKSRVWDTEIFIYCLPHQFREQSNVNKICALFNLAFRKKYKKAGQARGWGQGRSRRSCGCFCLYLEPSLQTCCDLKPAELPLPGRQADANSLGRYDAGGEKRPLC